MTSKGRVYFSGPFENCDGFSIVRDNPDGGDPIIIATIKRVHHKDDLLEIIRAVNAHDDLVKLLTKARRYVATCGDRGSDPASDLLARIDATLSRHSEG